ncbi:hypothetical protein [Shewanella insulae]|uniref:hypothetical protein n=1 Tax=Shewanella insulae TaxID=2681496 RepID=UPI00248187A2|nr:hypothetical protein [Shewanella insulae]
MKAKLLLPLFFILTSAQGAELPDNAPYDLASMEVDVDKFIEMNVSRMKADGDFTAMEQVSGIGSGKLERGYRSAMKFCFDKYEQMTEENAEALSNCFIDQTAAEFGVTNEQFYVWLDELDSQDGENPDAIEALDMEMDKIHEAIFALQDKPELTQAEQEQLANFEQQLIELGEKQHKLQLEEAEAMAAEMEAIYKRK